MRLLSIPAKMMAIKRDVDGALLDASNHKCGTQQLRPDKSWALSLIHYQVVHLMLIQFDKFLYEKKEPAGEVNLGLRQL